MIRVAERVNTGRVIQEYRRALPDNYNPHALHDWSHDTMTAEEPENRSSATVEHAMNQVLQAERGAEQAVDACAA